jgi:hypothetical protein
MRAQGNAIQCLGARIVQFACQELALFKSGFLLGLEVEARILNSHRCLIRNCREKCDLSLIGRRPRRTIDGEDSLALSPVDEWDAHDKEANLRSIGALTPPELKQANIKIGRSSASVPSVRGLLPSRFTG